MTNDDTPTYNLKAVVRETGLKPDTLRAWERRYGVPDPDRTGGGHRLFSQQDINTLKWLLARQNEGMSISRAVSLWRSLRAEGQDPFYTHPLSHTYEPQLAVAPVPLAVEMGHTVAELRRGWVEACVAFDEQGAEVILNQAFAYFSPEVVCFELLQKGLADIGNGWYSGAISVQQEHFASALALRRLDALLAATPAPTRPGRLIIGCPPGESHTFSPLLLAYLMRRRGRHVIYLGADVPTQRLQATIEWTRPNLVVFSAQLLDTAASLLDTAHFLQSIDVPLAFGGKVFNHIPALRRRIPGHFLGEELSQAPAVAEQLLLQQPSEPPQVEEPSALYRAAWLYFREHAGLIETQLWQDYRPRQAGRVDSIDVSVYMTRNILSALKLGELHFVDDNLHWIAEMLSNHNIPSQELVAFLHAYHQAAAQHLSGPAGRLVLDWLASTVATAGNMVAHQAPPTGQG